MWTPKPAIELSSQRAVRRHNLSVVLRQVVERGPRSRATIAHGHRPEQEHRVLAGVRADGVRAARRARRRAPRNGRAAGPGGRRRARRRGRARAGGQRRLRRRAGHRPRRRLALQGRWRPSTTAAAPSATSSTGLGELTQRRAERGAGAGPAPDRRDRRGARPGRHPARRAAGRAEPALGGRRRSSSCCASASTRQRCRSASTTRPTSPRWPSCGRARRPAYSDFMYASGEIGVGGGARPRRRAVPRLPRVRRRVRPHDRRARRAARARAVRAGAWRRARAWSRCWPPPGLNGEAVTTRGAGKPVAELRPARGGAATPPRWPRWPSAGAGSGVALGTVVNLL